MGCEGNRGLGGLLTAFADRLDGAVDEGTGRAIRIQIDDVEPLGRLSVHVHDGPENGQLEMLADAAS